MSNIKITDSSGQKPAFWQWDSDRVLLIFGATSRPFLHFANDFLTRAIVVETEEISGGYSCKVPNFALQFPGPMVVSVFLQPDEGMTVARFVYAVHPKMKPQDYTYDENISYVNWVQKSAQAQALIDEIQEMLDNGDFKGDKGDPFTYADFTEEQLAGLKGDKGDKGDTGQQGAQGEALTWDDLTDEQKASLKGETGPRGAQGPQGVKGDAFTFADFTEEQLASLKGPQGPEGQRGPQGPRGLQGLRGEAGARGPAGPAGATGPQGADGVGVPSGGTTGQVLAKASGTDYDTEWVDQSGGGTTEVFVATVGTTTADEICQAYADRKVCLLRSNTFSVSENVYQLVWCGTVANLGPSGTVMEKKAIFASVNGNEVTTISVMSSTWSSASTTTLAKLASPTFTGTPKAPTAASGTNTTQIATTAFVQDAVSDAKTAVFEFQVDETNNYAVTPGTGVTVAAIEQAASDGKTVFAKITFEDAAGATILPMTFLDADESSTGHWIEFAGGFYEGGGPNPVTLRYLNTSGWAFEIQDYVKKSQGVAHAGDFLVVGSDGNVTTVTMTAWQGGNY